MKKEKEKPQVEYNSKTHLIEMILVLINNAPIMRRRSLMEFLLMNYRGFNLSSVETLKNMPYDELERMYISIKYVIERE
jgi:hypothetical protein